MPNDVKSRTSIKQTRNIPAATRVILSTQAGGRCEFDGCNKYLLEHYPTETAGNFSEQAHIYGFEEGGPRGREEGRPDDINSLSNLMLLCPACHKLVDDFPGQYPVSVLRKFKKDHEDRIFDLTALSKDRDTVPLVFKGMVAGRAVDISDEQMQVAVAPNYLKCRDKIAIELANIPDAPDPAYCKTAASTIDRSIGQLYSTPVGPGRTLRLSVFALGPMPLLVYLGSRLSDKMEVDFYQRHRNPETWQWQQEPGQTYYVTKTLRDGTDKQFVALLLNLSGANGLGTLPAPIDDRFTVYEITLRDGEPNPMFLKCRSDLGRFHDEYVQTMAMIVRSHPNAEQLHLFPAVPAPVALVIGRSRLPKIVPALQVYDRDNRAGGFVQTMEIKLV